MASYLPPSLGSVFNKTPFIYGANYLSLQEAFKYFSPISVQNALTDFLINGFTIQDSKYTNSIISNRIMITDTLNNVSSELTQNGLSCNGIFFQAANLGIIGILENTLDINNEFSIQSFNLTMIDNILGYNFYGTTSPSQLYIYITGGDLPYTIVKSGDTNIFWPVDVSLITINPNTKWILTVLCDNTNFFFSFQQYA
jgi:hypothetical protein